VIKRSPVWPAQGCETVVGQKAGAAEALTAAKLDTSANAVIGRARAMMFPSPE
jgi:hypothetical protein